MRRQRSIHIILGASLLTSCGSPVASSGFSAAAGGIDLTGDSSSTSTSSSSSSSTSTSSASSTNSTSSTSSTSTSDAESGDETTAAPAFDLGCAGKIDLLFVLSNQDTMEPHAHQLEAALPAFIETIRTRFDQFDTQVMVMDANGIWGAAACQDCVGTCKAGPPEHPCLAWYELEACDTTSGAGVTFPAGHGTQNKRCDVPGGRRYLRPSDPHFEETFLCLASVGYSGGSNAPVKAMLRAVSADLTGPQGCNAGFLRDDALLVVVLIADTYEASAGEPAAWQAELLQAKGDDPDALVLLAVTTDIDLEQHLCLWWKDTNPKKNPLRALIELMPHALIGSICAPSWGPFFEEAAELVVEQCQVFVPPQ